jgi:hypothetical protein
VPLVTWGAAASTDELRSFDYYLKISAPSLAGDLDSPFWNGLVLRLCQAEPAVRHSVFALSSLHEIVELGGGLPVASPNSPRFEFAIKQYSKAIANLLSPEAGTASGQDAAPVYLLTCILFVCIESMLGNDRASLTHIEQGRDLLKKLGDGANGPSPQLEMIKCYLVPMYNRLGVTSFSFGGNPVAIPPQLKTFDRAPSEFESIEDARIVLFELLEDGLRFSRIARPMVYEALAKEDNAHGLETEQQQLLSRLAAWKVAFSLYLAFRSTPQKSLLVQEQILDMYYHTACIWISTALSVLECSFDDYLERFVSIISLGASIVDLQHSCSSERSQIQTPSATPGSPTTYGSSTFTFENHIVAPLYYATIKCRHPRVRRAALEILKRTKIPQESLYDARHLIPASARLIEVEEQINKGDGNHDMHEAAVNPVLEAIDKRTLLSELKLPLRSSDREQGLGHQLANGQSATQDSLLRLSRNRDLLARINYPNRNTQPPFGVPEHRRVIKHAPVNPPNESGAEGGIWIAMFTKPNGPVGEWDLVQDFVPI